MTLLASPALVQHRHGHDASHLFAGFTGLSDGGDDLAQVFRRLSSVLPRVLAFRVSQHLAINPQGSQDVSFIR